ncbi:MAG: Lrp/AsnC family transcriptional regulator [Rhizorhabdus sp.]|uniref:Lrp/AsnC family transcriptional regulator n=1 Tax=Rhizorhabdus sp. TaxID=1968843 RepID=UPI001B50CB6E|nr:Lrp/AsnC family transcriptional regulator [Rhizorhabdus sp.]MBP8234846.1 Lrp/AsnC family transcriptional regulator [Rhizorhabdus sp.]
MATKKPTTKKKTAGEETASVRQAPPPPPAVLEPIDEKIIAALRQSGRIANRDLARLIDVNEATVRTRLRKLESTNAVRVVAMRDLTAMGFNAIAAVGVQVKGRSAAAVGAELAELENVITVNVTIGMYDLEAQVVADNIEELDRLLTDVIAHIDGVERLFPGLSMKILKYNPEWAPL